MEEIHKETIKYSLPEIKRAIRLLETEQFINLSDLGNPMKKDNQPRLFLTLKGKDAFIDDYFGVENRKDRLQSIELKTKWIIPLISTGISIIALIVALFNTCHSKK